MMLEEKLKDAMIDPSLLYRHRFWENKLWETPTLKDFNFYIPNSLYQISEKDIPSLTMFYVGGFPARMINFEELKERSKKKFEIFDREEYIEKIPKQFLEKYEILQSAYFRSPIKEILLDEFVFLTTKSCLLSALKKVFKQFEKLNVFPLINLEEKVPEEWKETVSGLKKLANWVAFLGTFTVTGDPILSTRITTSIETVRLILIDP